MPNQSKGAAVLSDSVLYICDNGEVRCGAHCGHTARMTGRDISGQPVQAITEDDQQSLQAEHGFRLSCEECADADWRGEAA